MILDFYGARWSKFFHYNCYRRPDKFTYFPKKINCLKNFKMRKSHFLIQFNTIRIKTIIPSLILIVLADNKKCSFIFNKSSDLSFSLNLPLNQDKIVMKTIGYVDKYKFDYSVSIVKAWF